MSPSGLRGNLTDCDRRASPVGSCSPGRSSDEGAPVRELIQLSVPGEPLVNSAYSPLCRHSVGPAGRNVFTEWSKYDLVISLDSPLCRHPVWPDGGSLFAELDMSLCDSCLCVCRQLLVFSLAVRRTASASSRIR